MVTHWSFIKPHAFSRLFACSYVFFLYQSLSFPDLRPSFFSKKLQAISKAWDLHTNTHTLQTHITYLCFLTFALYFHLFYPCVQLFFILGLHTSLSHTNTPFTHSSSYGAFVSYIALILCVSSMQFPNIQLCWELPFPLSQFSWGFCSFSCYFPLLRPWWGCQSCVCFISRWFKRYYSHNRDYKSCWKGERVSVRSSICPLIF